MFSDRKPDFGEFKLTWEQIRVLQHVMDLRSVTDDLDEVESRSATADPWFDQVDSAFRKRATYFHSLISIYSQLGSLPAELRLSFEPFNPLPNKDRDAFVAGELRAAGVVEADPEHGLTALSRALVESYSPISLFDTADVPKNHSDLYLFDPLTGFLIWRDGDRNRNFWLGNLRDLREMDQQAESLRRLLIQKEPDHFSLGKSLLMRLVGPFLKKLRSITFDSADVPIVEVDSQHDLEALGDDLKDACAVAPAHVRAVFRGQTSEYQLPDRTKLVAANVCPFSDVRDHSVVPSLYRRYDGYLNDLKHFRAFMSHLLDWGLYSDLVFGDPAQYFTLAGKPYTPKDVPLSANATISLAFSGESELNRAFEDLGPYTTWRVTDSEGNVLDEYVKRFRPGHETVRRNLILQHYGAPTPFIDVTHDIRVAEWFALHQLTVKPNGLSASGQIDAPFKESAIFVFLILEGLAPVVDTKDLVTPLESLRPHRQACAVLGGAGNLYRNAVNRFIALKIKFGQGFVPSGLPTAEWLFPGPDEDRTLEQLLSRYRVPSDAPSLFPVYWFPTGTATAPIPKSRG